MTAERDAEYVTVSVPLTDEGWAQALQAAAERAVRRLESEKSEYP